jgi:hypothetical protein
MNLIIDNNDGLGGVDYTQAVLRDAPLTIRRRRNAWAECSAGLDLVGTGLPLPLSRARILLTDTSGAVLFQGFLQGDATASGTEATTVAVEAKPFFVAVEQGWLLGSAPPDALQPATAAQHNLSGSDATITFLPPSSAGAMQLATDVSVAGEQEATAYVTELFRGDGTTLKFSLAHGPFRESGAETLVSDSFDGAVLNAAVWARTDPGSYLSLGGGGLQIAGGNGSDGATLLKYVPEVELGGTLIAEAANVELLPGSDGLLLGFYNGAVTHATCMAGIRVLGAAGSQTLVPLVNGVEQPTSYSFSAGHRYALRLRLHCAEIQRQRQSYQVLVEGVLQQFGGVPVAAPLHLVIEVLDLGLASSTLATVLFDGAIATSPSQAVFAPVNSTQITGSVGEVTLTQTGSAWVVSTTADGTQTARREGTAGTGADYTLSSAGMLTFDTGRVPQPGELLCVTYRRSSRASARLKDAAEDQARLQLALPGLPAWIGKVLKPKARSSADCTAAAQALLAFAGSSSAGMAGHVSWKRTTADANDVVPGDTLALQTSIAEEKFTGQEILITDAGVSPELLQYRMNFRQDRETSLSFTVSDHPASDLLYPLTVNAGTSTAPAALVGLQVTSATTAALQIDSGTDAPAGGGFEVRRSDANFGSSNVGDLVLNSPVRSFSIPRVAFQERFFVRMYDGSINRQYSPVSSVVLTSLPTS